MLILDTCLYVFKKKFNKKLGVYISNFCTRNTFIYDLKFQSIKLTSNALMPGCGSVCHSFQEKLKSANTGLALF